MQPRIETSRDALLSFIYEACDYPNKSWDHDMLARCIILRWDDEDGEAVGYMWGHWVDDFVLTCHACFPPNRPVDWRDVLPKCEFIARMMGADEVVIALHDVPRHKAMSRLLRRLGFEFDIMHQAFRKVFDGKPFLSP